MRARVREGYLRQLEAGPRNNRAISLSPPRALAGDSSPAPLPVAGCPLRAAAILRRESCSKPGPGRSGEGLSDMDTARGVLPSTDPSSDTVCSLQGEQPDLIRR